MLSEYYNNSSPRHVRPCISQKKTCITIAARLSACLYRSLFYVETFVSMMWRGTADVGYIGPAFISLLCKNVERGIYVNLRLGLVSGKVVILARVIPCTAVKFVGDCPCAVTVISGVPEIA